MNYLGIGQASLIVICADITVLNIGTVVDLIPDVILGYDFITPME